MEHVAATWHVVLAILIVQIRVLAVQRHNSAFTNKHSSTRTKWIGNPQGRQCVSFAPVGPISWVVLFQQVPNVTATGASVAQILMTYTYQDGETALIPSRDSRTATGRIKMKSDSTAGMLQAFSLGKNVYIVWWIYITTDRRSIENAVLVRVGWLKPRWLRMRFPHPQQRLIV